MRPDLWLAGDMVARHHQAVKTSAFLTIALFSSLTCQFVVHGQQAESEHWTEFRGPGSQGHAPNADVPLRWGGSQNIAWRTPVAGKAWSSPVVVGSRVFVTTAVTDSDDGKSPLTLLALAFELEPCCPAGGESYTWQSRIPLPGVPLVKCRHVTDLGHAPTTTRRW
ncbi:PQQ-binding-like beta-propeller repeat protein [bacterium]|nr:PQQ-binding-like beta-propeller repeat protein [bacterium]